MIFKTKKNKFNETTAIKINGQIIKQVKCTKFLGLNMDEELSWKDHIHQVAKKDRNWQELWQRRNMIYLSKR